MIFKRSPEHSGSVIGGRVPGMQCSPVAGDVSASWLVIASGAESIHRCVVKSKPPVWF